VPDVETTSRTTVRALCVAIALPLALLMTAWSPSARTGAAQAVPAARQSPCGSPGQVYTQKIIVAHKNGPPDLKTLFLVCRPSHVLAIVDSDGGTYKDLDDFRAHNHLFSEDDRITLPRNFPSADTSSDAGFMTVSGHTGTSSTWWWLIGGIVLVLVIGGGAFLRPRARRRRAGAEPPDADVREPSP
jgi:LPXTG-motif cell wall-anchored protein